MTRKNYKISIKAHLKDLPGPVYSIRILLGNFEGIIIGNILFSSPFDTAESKKNNGKSIYHLRVFKIKIIFKKPEITSKISSLVVRLKSKPLISSHVCSVVMKYMQIYAFHPIWLESGHRQSAAVV